MAESTKAVSFPAGRRQAKIQLPACILAVSVEEVDVNADSIAAAITAGATSVLLVGSNDTGKQSSCSCVVGFVEVSD